MTTPDDRQVDAPPKNFKPEDVCMCGHMKHVHKNGSAMCDTASTRCLCRRFRCSLVREVKWERDDVGERYFLKASTDKLDYEIMVRPHHVVLRFWYGPGEGSGETHKCDTVEAAQVEAEEHMRKATEAVEPPGWHAQLNVKATPPLPPDQGCKLPPPGWYCSREPGHDGPCAAYAKPVDNLSTTDAKGEYDPDAKLVDAILVCAIAMSRFDAADLAANVRGPLLRVADKRAVSVVDVMAIEVVSLSKTIADLKKHIADRDATIDDMKDRANEAQRARDIAE